MVLDVGVVAENSDIEDSLTRKGLYGINEREMLAAFEVGMLQGPPRADENMETRLSRAQIVLGLEPAQMAAAMTSADTADMYWWNDARLATLRSQAEAIAAVSGTQKKQGGGAGFAGLLLGKSADEVLDLISAHIVHRCAKILMLPLERFDPSGSSVASHGVDSMIGVELRTWLFKEFGLEVKIQTISSPKTTFVGLARMVAEHLEVLP